MSTATTMIVSRRPEGRTPWEGAALPSHREAAEEAARKAAEQQREAPEDAAEDAGEGESDDD